MSLHESRRKSRAMNLSSKVSTACVVVCTLAAIVGVAPRARAGGFTQPVGSYYVKIWDRSLVSPSEGAAFDADGKVVSGLSGFQDHQLNLYAEVGWLDGLTLLGFSAPVGWARFGRDSALYMGPTGLGARVRLLDFAVKVAVQGQYTYAPPLGDAALGTETAGPTKRPISISYVPTVSTHAAELQLQAGYAMTWGWLTGSGGFRANSQDRVGHAATGFAQLGVSRFSPITFDLHANLYQSLDDIEVVNLAGAGRTSYLGIGIGAGYALTERVAVVGSFESVMYAKSNAAAPSLALGVELRPKAE